MGGFIARGWHSANDAETAMSDMTTTKSTRPRCTSSPVEHEPPAKRARLEPRERSPVRTRRLTQANSRRVTRAISTAASRSCTTRLKVKPAPDVVNQAVVPQSKPTPAPTQVLISGPSSSCSSQSSARAPSPSPWVVIPANNPIKLQALVDFLTPAECYHLITRGQKFGFTRSVVTHGGPSVVSQERTSTSCNLTWLVDAQIQVVRRRVAQLTGLPITHQELCLARYENGQQFTSHWDSIAGMHPRRYTVLCYLNDDANGGATSFPQLGVTVRPKTRAALFWENQPTRRRIHDEGEHAGLVVTSGVKYVLNIFVQFDPLKRPPSS